MRFDPTHFEPLSATPAKPRLAPLTPLPASPRLPWKEAPFATAGAAVRRSRPAVAKTTEAPKRAMSARPAAAATETVPRGAKLGRAELRTLLAIDLEGGEVCVRREGDRLRYERVDACGDVLERYPGATVRALIAAGHLRLRRCAHGGNVYAVAGDPVGRAGYRGRPERSAAGRRQRSATLPRG